MPNQPEPSHVKSLAQTLKSKWSVVQSVLLGIMLLGLCTRALGHDRVAQENILFYPAYGIRVDEGWEVELRVWVYEERALAEVIAGTIASSFGEVSTAQKATFRKRARNFLADSETLERVEFSFENDPQDEVQQLLDTKGKAILSDANGNIIATIRLSDARAKELLIAQKSDDGWLTIAARSKKHIGTGRIRMIEPEGLSIISDIDDTLRITEIPAGAKVVTRNTFLRDFVPTTELRPYFEMNPTAPVHYVSAGPWQLYQSLSEDLIAADDLLPEGTFHMRALRTNFMSVSSWQDFGNVLLNEDGTLDHKLNVIRRLMRDFPSRQFLLLGDSGEKDPEVYRRIQEQFPKQVKEIIIRDVVNAAERKPDRLKGMTVVPAPTVIEGKSQFDNP